MFSLDFGKTAPAASTSQNRSQKRSSTLGLNTLMPSCIAISAASAIALSLSLSSTSAAFGQTTAELITKGKRLQFNGDDQHAVECFDQAIAQDPKNSVAYSARGDSEIQWAMGLTDRAILDYSKAFELDPTDYHANLFRGYSYLTSNEAAAKKTMIRAVENARAKPQDASTVACCALAAYWMDYRTSLPEVKRWVQLYPNDPEAQFTLACNLDLLGKKSESIPAFRKAIEQLKIEAETHKEANVFRMLARSYSGINKKQEGIDWFEGYLKRHPKSVYANYWRGYLLALDKQMNLAIPQLYKAIELGPRHAGHLSFLAAQLMAVKKYRDAATVYRRAIALVGHSDAQLVTNRALCLKELGMTELAIVEVQKQLETAPDSYKLWHILSDLERPTKSKQSEIDLDKAINLIGWRIHRQPENASYYIERIAMLEKAHRPRKAYKDIEKALELKPADPVLYHKKADLEWRLFNQKLEAIADQTRAIEFAAASSKAAYTLTRCGYYIGMGMWPEAMTDANTCIALEPDRGHAYRMRGQIHMSQHEYHAALPDFAKAIQFRSTAADDVDYLYGCCLAQLGKRKDAITALNTSLAHNPRHVGSLIERGRLYTVSEEYDAALKDLNEALQIDPNNSEATYMRSRAYGADGDFARAIQDITTTMSLKREMNSPWLLEERARLFTYAELYKQAAADLAQAYRYDRSKPGRILNCGKLLYHAGEKQKAIEAISSFLDAVPNDIRALRARARCYFETEQYAKSVSDYTTLLRENPDNPVFYRLRAKSYLKLGDQENYEADTAKVKQLTALACKRLKG
jgi:tetratricopeptide (TPR) repeat protein